MAKSKLSIEERFWSKVNKNGPLIPGMKTRCWVWTAGCFSGKYNYGAFKMNGKQRKAHRVAWGFVHGEPPPPDKMLCHRCDNPPCVRHLFVGSNSENQRDSVAKGRSGKGNAWSLKRGDAHWTRVHPERLPNQKGAANRASKLTEASVSQMREQRAAGRKLEEIAQNFEVAMQTVSKIVRGERWRHVT